MVTRTKRVALTFQHPFSLKGVDRRLAAGQYEVVTDEELIEELAFPVYRRVATLIFLPSDAYEPSSIEMVNVDPVDLAAAQEQDQAASQAATVAAMQRKP
jgi:hypothetical protein